MTYFRTLNIYLKIICRKFVDFVPTPASYLWHSQWQSLCSVLLTDTPRTPPVCHPNDFTEWITPTQVTGDTLGTADRHVGQPANSISDSGLSRQTRRLPPCDPPCNSASLAAPSSCRLVAICLRQSAAIFHVPILSSITKKKKKDGKYNGLKEFR